MSLSWLDPQHDPLDLRQKNQSRNTMYMSTISEEDRVKKEALHASTRDVMRNWHLEGSEPAPRTKERTRIPESMLEEIPGSKPRSKIRQRDPGHDGPRGGIIEGLGAADLERERRSSSRQSQNPLYKVAAGTPTAPKQSGRAHVVHVRDAERGDVPSYVIPHPSHPPIQGPRFIRDQASELLEVPGSHPKPPVDLGRPARDIMWERNQAVEGSSPGWKAKHMKEIGDKYGEGERKERSNPMDVKDINEDGVFHSTRVTNPLEPTYEFDAGDEMVVGAVQGSRPKDPPKPRPGPQSSLYTADIQGPKKYVQQRTGPRRDPRKLETDPNFTTEPTMIEPNEWIEMSKDARQAPVFGRKVAASSAGVAALIHDTPDIDDYPDTPRSDEGDDAPRVDDLPPRPASVASSRVRLHGPFAVPPLQDKSVGVHEMPPAGRPSSKVSMNRSKGRAAPFRRDGTVNTISGRPMTALVQALGTHAGATPRKTLTTGSLKAFKQQVPSDTRMARQRIEREHREDVESVRSLRF